MASRALSRSFLSSPRIAGNSFRATRAGRAASPTSGSGGRLSLLRNCGERRRIIESMRPLHSAVSSAKLVSHLAVSSTSCSALALGLQSYIHAPCHALYISRGSTEVSEMLINV